MEIKSFYLIFYFAHWDEKNAPRERLSSALERAGTRASGTPLERQNAKKSPRAEFHFQSLNVGVPKCR